MFCLMCVCRVGYVLILDMNKPPLGDIFHLSFNCTQRERYPGLCSKRGLNMPSGRGWTQLPWPRPPSQLLKPFMTLRILGFFQFIGNNECTWVNVQKTQKINVQWTQEVTLFHLIIYWIIIDIAYLFQTAICLQQRPSKLYL